MTENQKKNDRRLLWVWNSMKKRCDDPNSTGYALYGGRGIRYAKEWVTFDGFLESMLKGYIPGVSTLERINNNGNYEPSNCRWATRKEQANNTRRNRYITINGRTQTLIQWIEERGLKPSTVRQRFYVYKWPVEKALEIQVGE